MNNQGAHSACVDAWMRQAGAADLPSEQVVGAFQVAAAALWQRALVPLGEVTLGALFGRVLYTASERFPFLAPIEVQPSGLRFDDLRERAGSVPREELLAGLRFVLVEILTVIGNLTAEILSDALHDALSKAVPASAGGAVEAVPAGHPEQAAGKGEQS